MNITALFSTIIMDIIALFLTWLWCTLLLYSLPFLFYLFYNRSTTLMNLLICNSAFQYIYWNFPTFSSFGKYGLNLPWHRVVTQDLLLKSAISKNKKKNLLWKQKIKSQNYLTLRYKNNSKLEAVLEDSKHITSVNDFLIQFKKQYKRTAVTLFIWCRQVLPCIFPRIEKKKKCLRN